MLQTSKPFCGIEGINFYFCGGWSDPLIEADGKFYNQYDVLDYMWIDYIDYAADNEIEINSMSDEGFIDYLQSHTEEIFTLLDELESIPADRAEKQIDNAFWSKVLFGI